MGEYDDPPKVDIELKDGKIAFVGKSAVANVAAGA